MSEKADNVQSKTFKVSEKPEELLIKTTEFTETSGFLEEKCKEMKNDSSLLHFYFIWSKFTLTPIFPNQKQQNDKKTMKVC